MEEYLNKPIKEIISKFPEVTNILNGYNIGCAPCSVGSCLLKDIVEIHNLSPKEEQELMIRISKVIYPGGEIKIPQIKRKQETKPNKIKYSPPMEKLVNEHNLIKRWAALIPSVIEHLDVTSEKGKRLILDGVDFIRFYADKYHHAKEEDILFKYFDENLDILKAMHEDHENARGHVRAIIEALNKKDKKGVRGHLDSYQKLLIEHIKKEDEILYPWMDRNLSIAQVGELFAKFAGVDEKGDKEAMKRYETFVVELEKKTKKTKNESTIYD